MFPNRTIPLILLILVHIVAPLALVLYLLSMSSSQFDWLVKAVCVGTFILFVYFIGFWHYLSVYLSYLWVLLFIAAATISYVGVHFLPFFAPPTIGGWVLTGVAAVLSLAFIYLIVGAIRAYFYPKKPLELAFPFRNGVYSINWGGNGAASRLMNYHYTGPMHKGAGTNRPMMYAVDIEKLNAFGSSARGILPTNLEKYVTYHTDIMAPCDGCVVEVVDGLPNETPFAGNYPYNVGNHVVILKGDYHVLMGHMQKGSITVKIGDITKTGDIIGQVGNSGMTDAPHTHVHAMKASGGNIWLEEGIPILFDGKNPVKNTLFFR